MMMMRVSYRHMKNRTRIGSTDIRRSIILELLQKVMETGKRHF